MATTLNQADGKHKVVVKAGRASIKHSELNGMPKIVSSNRLSKNTAMPYNYCMQTVVETKEFQRCAKALKLSSTELQEIITFLAANPTAGDEIAGTGGARKVRFARSGSGKSGGYRIVTFYSGKSMPLFLLSMFAKNKKVNLTQSEKNTLKRVLKLLVERYKDSEM